MLFMVIERFRDNDTIPVYERVRDGGRMLPEGLRYSTTLCVEPDRKQPGPECYASTPAGPRP